MHRWIILFALAPLAACEAEPQRATLTDGSPETIEVLTVVLASAVGRENIRLGAGDPTRQPLVSVLPHQPGPMEGNSTAMPTLFEIVLAGGDCYARAQSDGELYFLAGLTCVPAE